MERHDPIPMHHTSGKRKWHSVNYGTSKMHDANIHKHKPPNFDELAQKYSSFATHVQRRPDGSPFIDWLDSAAVREFTKALLMEDYQLKIDLPPNQLCPTIPSRANYIHWIHDIVNPKQFVELDETITGIDIGTGASCIYPLLGTRIYGWSFLATDIDAVSCEWARKNIAVNELEKRIEVQLVQKEARVLRDALPADKSYTFCMCNPPFFETIDEACSNPDTVCTGTHNELITSGGEVAFVSNIIEDSLVLGTRISWYTSLLGRKSSIKPLRALLTKYKITNIQMGEFTQGKTTRWAIGWSFTSEGIAEKLKMVSKKINKSTTVTLNTKNPHLVLQKAREVLTPLCAQLTMDAPAYFLQGTASAGFGFELRILQFSFGQFTVDMKHKSGDREIMAEFFHDTLSPALQATNGL